MQISFNNKSGLISKFINQLYPSVCPSCSRATDNIAYAPFCTECWYSIDKYSGPLCRICSTPFSSPYSSTCGGCFKKPPLFSKAVSYGLYDGKLAAAINAYKFNKIKRLYKPLGKFLLEFDMTGIDAIISVPLSIKGLRERGFNQSLLLSKFISDNTRIPLIIDGLLKINETHPQIGLSAKERLLNLKGAFRTDRNFSNKSLMLIDDVMTTGATAEECSKQLLKAGAKDVVVLTLARASAL